MTKKESNRHVTATPVVIHLKCSVPVHYRLELILTHFSILFQWLYSLLLVGASDHETHNNMEVLGCPYAICFLSTFPTSSHTHVSINYLHLPLSLKILLNIYFLVPLILCQWYSSPFLTFQSNLFLLICLFLPHTFPLTLLKALTSPFIYLSHVLTQTKKWCRLKDGWICFMFQA